MPKSKTYEEFIEKFKPKLTTDDCATPEPVYDAVLGWVAEEYGVDPKCVVRPFWPGLDYQQQEYPEGCVVVDNPPFSILSKICEWYLDRDIKFFLFAPSLTALSGKNVCMRMNHIIAMPISCTKTAQMCAPRLSPTWETAKRFCRLLQVLERL